ncbi:MAG: hypothetical protein M1368_12690 [Thaumarchaeota archaeon]|nr:hypothetical protein [Nitrososphaerota archaeon]
MSQASNPYAHNCAICGKVITTELPVVCSEHVVHNKYIFILRDSYLPLKRITDELIRKHKDAMVLRVLFGSVMNFHMNSTELLWDPVKFSADEYNERFADVWEFASFLAYCRCRLEEVIPDLGVRVNKIISQLHSRPLRQSEIYWADLIQNNLAQELSLLKFSTYYLNGYFKLAGDEPENFSKLYVVPEPEPEGVAHFLKLMLMDANNQWYTWFDQLLVPSGTIKASRDGRHVMYDQVLLKQHFEVFKECWKKDFGNNFRFTFEDYENLRGLLKWIVCPVGYTWGLRKTASYLDTFATMNLSAAAVKETMKTLIQNKHVKLEGKELVETVKRGDLDAKLFKAGVYFSLQGVSEPIWFTPAPGWFLDSVRPVYMDFAISQNLVGPSFEDDVRQFCDWFSRGFKFDRTDSLFGLSITPSDATNSEAQQRVIAKVIKPGHKFSTVLQGKNVDGEIDLVVVSNNYLYLIEAKSVGLASRESEKYLKEKAPFQCAKYISWVKSSDEWKELLKNEGISDSDLLGIRVAILSSAIYGDLGVTYAETSETFAVVPEVTLFSVMAGVILGPKKDGPTRFCDIAKSM